MERKRNGDRNGSKNRDPELMVPPNDELAEQSVLGSMILSGDAIDRVMPLLAGEDFYQERHREIYTAVCHLRQEALPVDAVSVAERIEQRGLYSEIGGTPYLGEVMETVPHAGHAEYYAGLVRKKAVLRKLLMAGREMARSAMLPDADPEDLIGQADGSIQKLMESRVQRESNIQISDVLLDVHQQIGAARERGIPTGFPKLDRYTNGWQPGHLVVLGARPGAGKTALACNTALAAARGEIPVGFISLEQPRLQLAERFLAMDSRVDSHAIRCGELREAEREMILESSYRLSALPVWIDDQPARTVQQIGARARLWVRQQGIRILIVDYLQIAEPSDRRVNREQQVATMSREFAHLARHLEIPVLLLAQLNRSAELRGSKDKKPRLSDLRESGSLEQDANMVLFLHRPWIYDPQEDPADTKLIIAKNRDGETGEVQLDFRRHILEFVEGDGFVPAEEYDAEASF